MSSSAMSSCSIKRNTWTCNVNERVRQYMTRTWGWEQRGPALTSSVIMVGQSEVRCWGDIRRSSTLKNRNTWAWRMGTWGRRRLSTSRSGHRKHHSTFIFLVTCVCGLPCVWFTLYVWQVFLVLVHFAAVDSKSQAFEQHGPLLQFSISVGKEAQGAALGDSNPGWREAEV